MKINFSICLLAIVLIGISLPGYAQTGNASTVKPKPQPVDMGLSVKWSNIDLGATTTKTFGELYPSTTDVTSMLGEGWSVPTKEEFEELNDNCDKSINIINGLPHSIVFTSRKNGAKITFYIPKTYSFNPVIGAGNINPSIENNMKCYKIYHLFKGEKNSVFITVALDQRNSDDMKKLKDMLKQLGFENVKYAELPDKIRTQIDSQRPQDFFLSDYLEYIGTSSIGKFEIAKALKVCIRPVYKTNEDE